MPRRCGNRGLLQRCAAAHGGSLALEIARPREEREDRGSSRDLNLGHWGVRRATMRGVRMACTHGVNDGTTHGISRAEPCTLTFASA
eukprot:352079-Chlamydomonas_euryale.AAC.1